MAELVHVALRAIGVVLPGAAVLGWVELRGGIPAGDFGTFLGAMALSLLASAAWSAIDARRARTSRVLSRWVAIALVVSVGLSLATTLTEAGTPGGPILTAETVSLALFYGVPMLVAAGVGVAIAAPQVHPPRRHEDTAGTGPGH